MNLSTRKQTYTITQKYQGFDYWVLLLGMIIIKIPSIFGSNQSFLIRLLTLTPFLFSIAKNSLCLISYKSIRFDKRVLAILLIYMSVLGVSVIRSSFSPSFSLWTTLGNYSIWFTFACFSFLVFATTSNPIKIASLKNAVYYSVILYVIVNVAFYFLGLTNKEELYITSRPAIMLQFFGIVTTRVLFPLASGINSFGIIAGGALCIGTLLVLKSGNKNDKFFGFLGIISSLFAILLTDCRSGLFFAALTILIAIFFPLRSTKYLAWLPLLAPVIPFLYIFIQENIPYWFIQGLLRTPFFGNVNILSGRDYIWTTIINHYSHFQLIHFFGYGYHGEMISGLSQDYSYLFTNFVNSDWVTGHNYFLQTLLEIGYLGILIVLWLLIKTTTSLAKTTMLFPGDITHRILFFLMFYLIMAGTTETVLTTYHQELFLVFMLIIGAVGAERSINQYQVHEK